LEEGVIRLARVIEMEIREMTKSDER